jgi:hypothetical protein
VGDNGDIAEFLDHNKDLKGGGLAQLRSGRREKGAHYTPARAAHMLRIFTCHSSPSLLAQFLLREQFAL